MTATTQPKRPFPEALLLTAAAVTTSLDANSPPFVIVSGSTAGQVVRLPPANTIPVGSRLEVSNNSTQPLHVQNGAGATLGWISQGRTGVFTALDITSAGGQWLTRLESKGANRHYVQSTDQMSTTSIITYLTYLTLTVPAATPLPPGKYRVSYAFKFAMSNANRAPQVNLVQNGVSFDTFSQVINNTNERPFTFGTEEITLSSPSSPSFQIQFRNSNYAGSGTASLYAGQLEIERVDE